MSRAYGTSAYEANLARQRSNYQERKAAGICPGGCGRKPESGKVYCRPCVIIAGRRKNGADADDLYSPGDSRIHPESRGGHTHAVERQCANAYRVERYSRPAASWEVVIYAYPLARARAHAELLSASYREAGVEAYTRVRVVDSKGNET
jgi:hypothetical protein